MISYSIISGDSRSALKRLASLNEERQKYRLIVTSPPYYKARHYGGNEAEIGREVSDEKYLDELATVFTQCRDLLTEDGSLWIVIADSREKMRKLLLPHRLASKLSTSGFVFREDIIWYKKNNVSSSSVENFSQSYEYVLFFSKNERSYCDMNSIRIKGNEARDGRNKIPSPNLIQHKPIRENKKEIQRIEKIIHNAQPSTSFKDLPTTSEISWAHGYDPEKICPTCYRKFKRHATRKRIGDHKHYPIFAVCNPRGKNPGNVWEISTKAHHGNEHFAIFPEDLVARVINFASRQGDWILDPFMGRGTTGIVAALLQRNFAGIDIYERNCELAKNNIADAIAGRYQENFVELIKKETNAGEPGQDKPLEAYLVAS